MWKQKTAIFIIFVAVGMTGCAGQNSKSTVSTGHPPQSSSQADEKNQKEQSENHSADKSAIGGISGGVFAEAFSKVMDHSVWETSCFGLDVKNQIRWFQSFMLLKGEKLALASLYYTKPNCQGELHLLFSDVTDYKIVSLNRNEEFSALLDLKTNMRRDYRSLQLRVTADRDKNKLKMIFISSEVYDSRHAEVVREQGWKYSPLFEHQVFIRIDPGVLEKQQIEDNYHGPTYKVSYLQSVL